MEMSLHFAGFWSQIVIKYWSNKKHDLMGTGHPVAVKNFMFSSLSS